MRVSKGDYLIVRTTETKKAVVLARMSANSDEDFPIKCKVADEMVETKEADKLEIPIEDVLANLGSSPDEGSSAFGVKIQPWREEFTVRGWGPIQVFRSLSSKERSIVQKKLLRCGKTLRKRKLHGFTSSLTAFHIMPKSGQWAGMYSWNEAEGDKIELHPEDLTQDTSYVVYHESGHGVWYRLMNKKLHARWIKMYHRMVTVQRANPKTVTRLAKDFCNSGLGIKEFKKENLGEDHADLFDEMLDWVHSTHKLSSQNLDTLIEAGATKELLSYFPDSDLFLSDMNEELITKYATKKPEELFAEAFAFYMLKKKLPAGVTKLMKKTFRAIGAK